MATSQARQTDGKVVSLAKRKPAAPGYNYEAERAALGAILIAPEECMEEGETLLQPADFDEPKNASAFEACLQLYQEGAPINAVTIDEKLRQNGNLGLVGQAYVHQLVNTAPNWTQFAHYAEIVRNNSLTRQRQAVGAQLSQSVITSHEAMKRLQEIEDRAASSERDMFTLAELMGEDLEPVKWIVPGILPEGLGILGAKQKVGKSWFAYALAIAKASGGYFLGQRLEQGDVLYLALEDGKRRLKSRGEKILQGQPAPKGLTFATTWPRMDQGGLAKCEQWCKAHDRRALIIIDVIVKARPPRPKYADPYEHDYAFMSQLKALADQYHISVLPIHHTRKSEAADVFDELSGTMGIAGSCDTVMVLQRQRTESEAILHITGREIERESQLALRFDKNTCTWQYEGDAQGKANGPAQQRVLDAVKAGYKQPKAIAEYLGMEGSTVRTLLGRLVKQGVLRSAEYGSYEPTVSVDTVDGVDTVDSVDTSSNAQLSTVSTESTVSSVQRRCAICGAPKRGYDLTCACGHGA